MFIATKDLLRLRENLIYLAWACFLARTCSKVGPCTSGSVSRSGSSAACSPELPSSLLFSPESLEESSGSPPPPLPDSRVFLSLPPPAAFGSGGSSAVLARFKAALTTSDCFWAVLGVGSSTLLGRSSVFLFGGNGALFAALHFGGWVFRGE